MTFKNVHINRCDIGVSLPSNGSNGMNFDGLFLNDCRKAIEVRDPTCIFQMLGLPKNTPHNLLVEALKQISSVANEPETVKVLAFKNTRLSDWLGASANIATIIQAITVLHQSGFIASVIKLLS